MPIYSGVHSQWYPNRLLLHIASFWHGFGWQWSIMSSQFAPVYPEGTKNESASFAYLIIQKIIPFYGVWKCWVTHKLYVPYSWPFYGMPRVSSDASFVLGVHDSTIRKKYSFYETCNVRAIVEPDLLRSSNCRDTRIKRALPGKWCITFASKLQRWGLPASCTTGCLVSLTSALKILTFELLKRSICSRSVAIFRSVAVITFCICFYWLGTSPQL